MYLTFNSFGFLNGFIQDIAKKFDIDSITSVKIIPGKFEKGDKKYNEQKKHELADLLQDREAIADALQKTLDEHTNPWGITCQTVGIKDIVIPEALADAMSKQAQAERERQARGRPIHAAILHADAPDEAGGLRQRVAARFDCAELYGPK